MVWTKVITKRTAKKTLGFGADVQRKEERNVSAILKDVVPEDLLKFGLSLSSLVVCQ